MANRILRWFLFSVLFALLPIGISILLHILFKNDTYDLKNCSCELLFFVIVMSATTLGDIQEISRYIKKDFLIIMFFGVSIIFAIIAAILYGFMAYETMAHSSNLDMNMILLISIILGAISGVLGCIVQVLIQKTEKIGEPQPMAGIEESHLPAGIGESI